MKKINLALTLAFLNVMAFAQEKVGTDINVDINKEGTGDGSFPWMWVIGVAVFIIIIFALFSGRGGSDRVIEKKIIVKE